MEDSGGDERSVATGSDCGGLERGPGDRETGSDLADERARRGARWIGNWILGGIRSAFLVPLVCGYLATALFAGGVAFVAFGPETRPTRATEKIEGDDLGATFRSLWVAVDENGLTDSFLVAPVIEALPLVLAGIWLVGTILQVVTPHRGSWARQLVWLALIALALAIPLVAGGVVIDSHRGIPILASLSSVGLGAVLVLGPLTLATFAVLRALERLEKGMAEELASSTASGRSGASPGA